MTNYTDLADKIPANCYANYLRMMWALKKQIPEIDLSTITKDDILKNEYPVCSVVQAMDAGLLPNIDERVMLINKI